MTWAYAPRRKSRCAGSSGWLFSGLVEAEPPELGVLVGEQAVEGVVEHCRDELPHLTSIAGRTDRKPERHDVLRAALGSLER